MAQTQKVSKGGKCLTTSPWRKQKYASYGMTHRLAIKGHKFTASKEKRLCGPLARKAHRRAILATFKDWWEAPLNPVTRKMIAEARKGLSPFW